MVAYEPGVNMSAPSTIIDSPRLESPLPTLKMEVIYSEIPKIKNTAPNTSRVRTQIVVRGGNVGLGRFTLVRERNKLV